MVFFSQLRYTYVYCTQYILDENIKNIQNLFLQIKIHIHKFFVFLKNLIYFRIIPFFERDEFFNFCMTLFLSSQLIEAKISPRLFKNHSDDTQLIGKVENSLKQKTFLENEGFKIVRAMSLALSILTLCYYGLTEYNVLRNGQILHGFPRGFPSRKTVITFSFGYSVSYSIISAVATGMLIYSIIMV